LPVVSRIVAAPYLALLPDVNLDTLRGLDDGARTPAQLDLLGAVVRPLSAGEKSELEAGGSRGGSPSAYAAPGFGWRSAKIHRSE
jgi:hypothetical protein